jgi:dolichol-phosphate mannosyltransferase
MKSIVIIPTVNEVENINLLVNSINKIQKKIDILFVDDCSTDGSRELIIEIAKRRPKTFYLFRSKRTGVGSAHKSGIKFSYNNNYDVCITIDADGTHDPILIKKMIKLITKYDIVNTSRFINEKSLRGWSLWRIILTRVRYYLIRVMLNMHFDSSSGFRAYNLKTIDKKHILMSKENYYFFTTECLYWLFTRGYSIKDIPAILNSRKAGVSKIRIKNIFNALIRLLCIYFRKF